MPEINKLGSLGADDEASRRKKLLARKSLAERVSLNKHKEDTSGSVVNRRGGIKEMTFEYERKRKPKSNFGSKKRFGGKKF